MKAISPTSTKTDILQAYQELKAKLDAGTSSPEVPTTSLKTATNAITQSITTLVNLKTSVDDAVAKLEKQRQSQLEDEQRAQEELERFRTEMKRAKQELDYELKRTRQEKLDQLEVDLTAQRRTHDETLDQERRTLQEKREELERQETELKQLRKQVAEFPAELDKQLKHAVDIARSEEQTRAKVARDLMEKQVDGERAIAKLKVETLERTVKDQTEKIRGLEAQLEQATRQVKDIAVSVIESKRPMMSTAQPT